MTQAPKGEIMLRTKDRERQLSIEHESLYVRAVRLFSDAVACRGAPSATGEDGIRSLSVALSTQEAARTGREILIPLEVVAEWRSCLPRIYSATQSSVPLNSVRTADVSKQ